ncbi:metallophosphoesterase [Sphingobacterium sp. SRCM116780]|uniref:metallophosphoesterase n=1 Tax=Sphingobacterium sp. SRCM116780 TaxID=2907623 RepID=UPI001F303105|nr:metallophosphoesterase [Sphingobacterium sp. SRCM116780]UIR54799.1 metallophosphoesterase [Sphingobacterium sp. SRCM116780]
MTQRLILILLLFLVGDIYFYQAVVTLSSNSLIPVFYWIIDVLLLITLIGIIFLRQRISDIQRIASILITTMLLIFIPKLFAFPILFVEDIGRLFRGFPSRSVYVSEVVVIFAGAIFLAIVFGLTRGRHFYRVRKEILYFSDLPEAFDGFTITQLSDIHSGSFSNSKGVQKGIDLANAQNSDLLLFTGDLVNNMASEMDPWIDIFTVLKAPYGKYSVLGNHDYGDYVKWTSISLKEANLRRLKEIHREMGFKLLLNEAVTLHKQGERIALIGVENWGKGGFHQFGNLSEAAMDIPADSFKILMSHDPSHWDAVTVDHEKHVHLTLAGHTHGMQFGIELFGFKWSPIQYFYKQWAGLYQRDGKFLYVNRGFGFHGLKGRVGVWPEITVLTLKRSKT